MGYSTLEIDNKRWYLSLQTRITCDFFKIYRTRNKISRCYFSVNVVYKFCRKYCEKRQEAIESYSLLQWRLIWNSLRTCILFNIVLHCALILYVFILKNIRWEYQYTFWTMYIQCTWISNITNHINILPIICYFPLC